jgi:PKD repeat protein
MAAHRPAAVLLLVLAASLAPLLGTAAGDAPELASAHLPQPRTRMAAAGVGDAIYAAGGLGVGTQGRRLFDDIVRFDPASGSVSVLAARFPGNRTGLAAAALGGDAYFLGGADERTYYDEVWRLTPATGALVRMQAHLLSPRAHASAVADPSDGTIYVLGGYAQTPDGGNRTALRGVFRYDPARDELTTMHAELPSGRYSGSAVFDGDHAIYYFGGVDGSGTPLADIVRIDLAADAATVLGAQLPTGRYGTAAAWDGRYAWVYGGQRSQATDPGESYADAVRFDPQAGTVAVPDQLPRAIVDTAAARALNATWLLGGHNFTNNTVGGKFLAFQDTIVRHRTDVPPQPAFVATVQGLRVDVDASASADDRGIVSWGWDWGDGSPGAQGPHASHTYAAPGNHTVRLELADGEGLNATLARTFALDNAPPIAAFRTVAQALALTADAGDSTDPDGPIASYAWTWGDGATGSGRTATHVYGAPGNYSVGLRVRDGFGAEGQAQRNVTIALGNQPPAASFDAAVDGLAVNVSANASSDPEGAPLSFAWAWGDGAQGSGAEARHAYATAGTYTVTLTATDPEGASGSASRSIVVGSDRPPVAVARVDVQGLRAAADGRASPSPDGRAIVAYGWDWGDGSRSDGSVATHAYTQPGRYHVVLSVRDDAGRTARNATDIDVGGGTVPLAIHLVVGTSGWDATAHATLDGAGPDAQVTWDWGDGATGAGVDAAHSYAREGNVTVRATVRDGDRTATASRVVHVSAPPAPPPATGPAPSSPSATPSPSEAAVLACLAGAAVLARRRRE